MTDAVFALEKFDDCYPEAAELLHQHWEEIAEEQDILRLDPDLDTYHKLEAMGAIHILTARIDGVLVGYYVGIVRPMLHYKNVIMGSDDIYFIAPAYRKGMLGYRLFRQMFAHYKAWGCHLITVKTKVAHDHGALLTRLGMRPFEKSYIMRVK